MTQIIDEMLKKYSIKTSIDAENALKEIIQEIALLGLQRSNFFEKAAFYGGTALRVLYTLPRYSQDLDFTLFKSDPDFKLDPYFGAVRRELEAYGFTSEISRVDKNIKSDIESAFIKTNTKITMLTIEPLKQFSGGFQENSKLQIKFEVDTDPVTDFEYEARYLLMPTSFPVIALKKPDLFAGKLHALLFRKWKNRIKGRDFYDYIWYIKNNIPVRITYLAKKASQSGHLEAGDLKNKSQLTNHLHKRFKSIDFENAKIDVMPFIRDSNELQYWSLDFFMQATEKLEVI